MTLGSFAVSVALAALHIGVLPVQITESQKLGGWEKNGENFDMKEMHFWRKLLCYVLV